ncbi:MAG TPA: hypothetical protein VML75_19895 [Kofleriaceae bacterium]|nr:hypothetical protein [Kofleriaceae bacterium]
MRATPHRWLVLILLAAGCGADADFALLGPPDTVTLVRGENASILVSLERINGFADSVVITASGLRAGITPGALSLREGQDSGALLLAVESSTVEGPIEGAFLIGVAGDLEHTAPLSLVVASP